MATGYPSANWQNMQVSHLRQRYLWGPAVDQILAEENVDNGSDETVQWTLTDHLNTVRDIAKYDSGSDMTTAVNHLIYDAFGKVTSESNPTIDSLFLFTGRPFDSDTQLQNNLNRWYDARVGRWLSEDPIGFNGGDASLYRYVGNAPTEATDPNALKLVHCGNKALGLDKWIHVPDTWRGGDPCAIKLGRLYRVLSVSSDQAKIRSICSSIQAKAKECSARCCEQTMAKFLNAVHDVWLLNIFGYPLGPDTCQRWVFDLERRLDNFGLANPCIQNARLQTFRLEGGILSSRHCTYMIELADGTVIYADNGAWGGDDHIFFPEDIPDGVQPE
ncbi:MAG: RHS repeat-associated core domain-containing protein [Thermogutta sp.]